MTFSQLVQQIGKTQEIETISQEIDGDLQDVALIDGMQEHYHKNTLYFGYDNQIKAGSPLPPQCILARSEDPDAPDVFPTGGVNLALVESPALFSIFNQAKVRVEATRSRGLYEELTALADETRSLEAVLNAAAIRLGNSLVFNDTTFKIITSSTSIPVVDPLWKENIKQGYCSYEFIQTVRELEPLRNMTSSTEAVEVTCPESPYRKLSCKVFHNSVQVGFVLMIEGETLFLPSHREMLRSVSHALSYIIDRYHPELHQGASLYQQFLYDLLIGAPSDEMLARLNGIDFPPRMFVLFLQPTQFLGRRHLKEQVTQRIKQTFPGTHVTYHKNGVVALVPLRQTVEILPEHLASLKEFSQSEHVRAGISNAFSHIENFVTHYEQAHAAIELGQKLAPDETVCRYLDYQIFDLFSEVKNPDSLGRFCHPALALLRQYDHKNNTQFYQTLCVYLECGGSIKLTSERLFIHRNSLVYRMNRIAGVCQIDLEDPDTCLLLRISYFIDRYNGLQSF